MNIKTINLEEFKKDLLNPLFLNKDICRKHGISMSLKNRLIIEHNLKSFPRKAGRPLHSKSSPRCPCCYRTN